MLDIEIEGDPKTKLIYRLRLEHPEESSGVDRDLEFITKLANALLRSGTIVIDPGLATQFVYEPGRIDSLELNGEKVEE